TANTSHRVVMTKQSDCGTRSQINAWRSFKTFVVRLTQFHGCLLKTVRVWELVNEKGCWKVHLSWSSGHGFINMMETCIHGARGLSDMNSKLLKPLVRWATRCWFHNIFHCNVYS